MLTCCSKFLLRQNKEHRKASPAKFAVSAVPLLQISSNCISTHTDDVYLLLSCNDRLWLPYGRQCRRLHRSALPACLALLLSAFLWAKVLCLFAIGTAGAEVQRLLRHGAILRCGSSQQAHQRCHSTPSNQNTTSDRLRTPQRPCNFGSVALVNGGSLLLDSSRSCLQGLSLYPCGGLLISN